MLPSMLPVSSLRCLVFCLFIASFELLAYTASDMVMPAMLDVTTDLGAPLYHVPLALSLYLIGGVSLQWLLGPLSDRIGRRPMMLMAGALFALSSLLLAASGDIMQFQLLRLLQGVGLGFVITAGYPALQEAFNRENALRVTALFANIALLSPLLAPLAGVMLAGWLHWRWLFLLQGMIAVLITAGLYFSMPETIGVQRVDGSVIPARTLSWRTMLAAYGRALSHRHFIACCVAIGLIATPLISWVALSPVLLMHGAQWRPASYGLAQVPVFGALIAGNLILSVMAVRYPSLALLRHGRPQLMAGMLMILFALALPQYLWPLMIGGLAVYAIGVGIVNTTLYRMALFAPGIGTGAAAALLGTITVLLFAGGSLLVGAIGATTDVTLFGVTILGAATLALCALQAVFNSAGAAAHIRVIAPRAEDVTSTRENP